MPIFYPWSIKASIVHPLSTFIHVLLNKQPLSKMLTQTKLKITGLEQYGASDEEASNSWQQLIVFLSEYVSMFPELPNANTADIG